MIHISAEGTEFEYVTAAEDVASVRELLDDIGIPDRYRFGCDTRIALFKSHLPPHRMIPYVLTWQGACDLKLLDNQLEMGICQESVFSRAFRTHPHELICPGCNLVVEALTVDAGDPYPLAPNLHRLKSERLKTRRCPNCQASFRVLVVKVISVEFDSDVAS